MDMRRLYGMALQQTIGYFRQYSSDKWLTKLWVRGRILVRCMGLIAPDDPGDPHDVRSSEHSSVGISH